MDNNTNDFTFKTPPPNNWRVSLTKDFFFCIYRPDAPSVFYRFMQRLILGIYWERIKKEKQT